MLKKMVSRCGTNLMVKQNVDAEVDDKLLCVTFSHIISFSYTILQDCKFFFAYFTNNDNNFGLLLDQHGFSLLFK